MKSGLAWLSEDMSIELGRIGIWRHPSGLTPDLVAEVEALGYGTIWIGGSPDGDLAVAENILDATDHIAVATGILNVWKDDATPVAASYHRITAKHPGRFLLGLGIGHPEATQEYQQPYAKLVSYLDELDELKVPAEGRVLAALGPKVLRLAAERSAGAHPYLVTPEHTRWAREILGDGPLLAPEQKIVLETDPERARAIGRPRVQQPYLGLTNYLNSLRRLGWTDADFADGGSDALIDALALHGDAEAIARGITAHLDAGADHVAIQVLNPDPQLALQALSNQLQLPRGRLDERGADEPVPGDQRGQFPGGQRAGPGRAHRQHHVAGLRRRIPDRDLDLIRKRHAELTEHGPRLPDRSRPVGEALVPARRGPEQRHRVAGAERADDDVVRGFVVGDDPQLVTQPGEAKLRRRGVSVGQQEVTVAGVGPRPGGHPGAVQRRTAGGEPGQERVDLLVAGQPGGDQPLLELARPRGDRLRLMVIMVIMAGQGRTPTGRRSPCARHSPTGPRPKNEPRSTLRSAAG
jgi:probable F420-dependent oxidoreductase